MPDFPSFSRWAKDHKRLLLGSCAGPPRRLPPDWRHGAPYRIWRSAVAKRDGDRCTHCGTTIGPLQAHHIVPAVVCPALRYHPVNGRVLCERCHHLPEMHQFDRNWWHNIFRDLRR